MKNRFEFYLIYLLLGIFWFLFFLIYYFHFPLNLFSFLLFCQISSVCRYFYFWLYFYFHFIKLFFFNFLRRALIKQNITFYKFFLYFLKDCFSGYKFTGIKFLKDLCFKLSLIFNFSSSINYILDINKHLPKLIFGMQKIQFLFGSQLFLKNILSFH